MSSSRDKDKGGKPDRGQSPGFIKSVIQALSGPRFSTPEGSVRNSPTGDNYEEGQPHQLRLIGRDPDGVEGRTAPGRESPGGLEERVSEDDFMGPIKGSKDELRYIGKEVESSFSAVLTLPRDVPTVGESPILSQFNESLSRPRGLSDTVIEHDVGRGLSQASSSSPLFRPVGKGLPQVGNESESPPLFFRVGNESANKGMDGSPSLRIGHQDIQNVTQRDAKRPKERSKDRAYKQRYSMASDADLVGYRDSLAFQTDPGRDHVHAKFRGTPEPSGYALVGKTGFPPSPPVIRGQGEKTGTSGHPENKDYEIFLIYSGTTVVHRVWESMGISRFAMEAAAIFHLDPSAIILVLFSNSPTTLDRSATILGPPRIVPGSRVMIFHVPGSIHIVPQPQRDPSVVFPSPGLNSKLLGSFKLPKFDGVARSWKLWEKSFHRFLGIHQLDHVLEEDFLSTLWTAPGAKCQNIGATG
jgi:hypothetical protein